MKARESLRFQEKLKQLFQPQGSKRRADCGPERPSGGKTGRRLCRAAPPGFGFVVKMYGLNVAQGWEQYSPRRAREATRV